jgi:hypothetical protein
MHPNNFSIKFNKLKNLCKVALTVILCAAFINCGAGGGGGVYHKEAITGETAILDWSGWGTGDVLEIDGETPAHQNHAELKPGKHNIRYGGEIGTSFLLNPKMSDNYDYPAAIDMRAGHTYKVMHERMHGYGSYRDYFWVEDASTGEIMAGNLPEYQREKKERSAAARVERQVEEHFEALTVSAECGDAKAQYDLGLYYLAGIPPVAEPDIVTAFVWYSLAASNGNPEALAVKGRILKDMRKENISEADDLLNNLIKNDCSSGPHSEPLSFSNGFNKKGTYQ